MRKFVRTTVVYLSILVGICCKHAHGQDCPYKLTRILEYPINKFYNSEFYITLNSACDSQRLKSICATIRKERKINEAVSASYHFVVNGKVRYRVMDNVKDQDGYYFFVGDNAKFDLATFLDSVKVRNGDDLPGNVVGYWSSASNPFTGLKLIYRQDTVFHVLNYFPNAESGHKEAMTKIRIRGRDYLTYASEGIRVYYYINEYGDIEYYADRFGFKMAFHSIYYKVD